MHRIRALLALGATVVVLAPSTVIAVDESSPVTTVSQQEIVVAPAMDAFAVLAHTPGVAIDHGVTLERTDPSQLPPPLDRTPSDATIYRIEASSDPGMFSYGRFQSRDDLSFVDDDRTPAILRVAMGSDEPRFLDDQRIWRLPPVCSDGAGIGDGCLSGDLRDAALLRSLRDALDLLEGPAIPSAAGNDLLTLGTLAGPATIVGFGGGIFTDGELDLSDGVGDSYEIRATQTIAELFGGEVGETSVDMLVHDPASGTFEPFDAPPIPVGPDGVTIPCPGGLSGIFRLETAVAGAGRNLPQTLGPGFDSLAAGTDILITELHPFLCPAPAVAGAGNGPLAGQPAVSLVCARARVNHTEFQTRIGRRNVNFPTANDFEGTIYIANILDGSLDPNLSNPDPMRLDITIEGTNRGRPIRTDLRLDGTTPAFSLAEGVDTWDLREGADRDTAQVGWGDVIAADGDVDGAAGEGGDRIAVARFRFKAGVTGTGPTMLERAVVRIGDKRADITDQLTDSLGTDTFRIRFPREDSWGGDCSLPPAGGPTDQPPYLPIILR